MKLYYFIYENGMTLKTYISEDKEKIKKQYRQLSIDTKYENTKKVNKIIEIDSDKLNVI